MFRFLYIVPLAILFTFWVVEDIYLMAHCIDAWLCRIWTWVVDVDYLFPLCFVLPWVFLIIYSFRRLRKYKHYQFERILILGLFLMYCGFFAILKLTGYNG
jgi:hypothetical protein